MIRFFHQLFNPHCEHCRVEKNEEREEEKYNPLFEELKLEIARLRDENKRLLDRILEKPKEPEPVDYSDLKPILPKHIPWNVKRQMLETESKAEAAKLKLQKEEFERLEKEMKLKENDNAVGSSDAQVETRTAS